jgi:hypothetical protein
MSEENNIHCSFCGRSKTEAEMMIAGVDAHICDRCVEQAGGILHTELGEAPQSSPLDVAGKVEFDFTPAQIKAHLRRVHHRARAGQAHHGSCSVQSLQKNWSSSSKRCARGR